MHSDAPVLHPAPPSTPLLRVAADKDETRKRHSFDAFKSFKKGTKSDFLWQNEGKNIFKQTGGRVGEDREVSYDERLRAFNNAAVKREIGRVKTLKLLSSIQQYPIQGKYSDDKLEEIEAVKDKISSIPSLEKFLLYEEHFNEKASNFSAEDEEEKKTPSSSKALDLGENGGFSILDELIEKWAKEPFIGEAEGGKPNSLQLKPLEVKADNDEPLEDPMGHKTTESIQEDMLSLIEEMKAQAHGYSTILEQDIKTLTEQGDRQEKLSSDAKSIYERVNMFQKSTPLGYWQIALMLVVSVCMFAFMLLFITFT